MGSPSQAGFSTLHGSGIRFSSTKPPEARNSSASRAEATRTAVPRNGESPVLRQNPRGRTLKSFTPSAEYNLERLTPEQMAEWLAELKREQGG